MNKDIIYKDFIIHQVARFLIIFRQYNGKELRVDRVMITRNGLQEALQRARAKIDGYRQIKETIAEQLEHCSAEQRLQELMEFIKQHGRYPVKEENQSLYGWIGSKRSEKRKGTIDPCLEEKLNDIGFIWDKQTYNWQEIYGKVKELLAQEQIPDYLHHPKLYFWLFRQFELLETGEIEEHKREQVVELYQMVQELNKRTHVSVQEKEKPSLIEQKWLQQFEILIKWREQHPNSWPHSHSQGTEKKLGIWVMELRRRYRQDSLPQHWMDKLSSIGFNFGGHDDNRMQRFKELSTYIQEHGYTLPSDHKLYKWTYLQYSRCYDQLSEERKELLHGISAASILNHNIHWQRRYDELVRFLAKHKKIPAATGSSRSLDLWLREQRRKYHNHELSQEQKEKLLALGIAIKPVASRRKSWEDHYESLVQFCKMNPDRWPRYNREEEKQLFIWCQTMRQIRAGTLPRRLPLDEKKVDLLNRINFPWVKGSKQN